MILIFHFFCDMLWLLYEVTEYVVWDFIITLFLPWSCLSAGVLLRLCFAFLKCLGWIAFLVLECLVVLWWFLLFLARMRALTCLAFAWACYILYLPVLVLALAGVLLALGCIFLWGCLWFSLSYSLWGCEEPLCSLALYALFAVSLWTCWLSPNFVLRTLWLFWLSRELRAWLLFRSSLLAFVRLHTLLWS